MFKRLLVGLGLLTLGAFAASAEDGLTLVAIAPCRIIDTRNGQGFTGQYGPPSLVANATRTFQMTGQCGIPAYAQSVLANFTVAGFSGAGDIRAFPAGGSVPNASILNYKLENIANMVTIGLSSGGAMTVQADVSPTQLIVDISGYYIANRFAAFVAADGTLLRGNHAVSAAHGSAGNYNVKFDRDLTNCFWLGAVARGAFGGVPTPGYATTTGLGVDSTGVFIQTFNTAGALTDIEFGVFVTCP